MLGCGKDLALGLGHVFFATGDDKHWFFAAHGCLDVGVGFGAESLDLATLSTDDLSHMLRTGHRNAFGHVLRLLGPDLVQPHAGQRVNEGTQFVPGVHGGLHHAAQGLVEAQHRQLQSQLEGSLIPYSAGPVHVLKQRSRHNDKRR